MVVDAFCCDGLKRTNQSSLTSARKTSTAIFICRVGYGCILMSRSQNRNAG
jgi:hypothetical protein